LTFTEKLSELRIFVGRIEPRNLFSLINLLTYLKQSVLKTDHLSSRIKQKYILILRYYKIA
jgi:hypothetical protein